MPALEAFRGRADALFVVLDPLISNNRLPIASFALGARMPTMHGLRELVEAGGLMSYGANFPDLFRRTAGLVDKDTSSGLSGHADFALEIARMTPTATLGSPICCDAQRAISHHRCGRLQSWG